MKKIRFGSTFRFADIVHDAEHKLVKNAFRLSTSGSPFACLCVLKKYSVKYDDDDNELASTLM